MELKTREGPLDVTVDINEFSTNSENLELRSVDIVFLFAVSGDQGSLNFAELVYDSVKNVLRPETQKWLILNQFSGPQGEDKAAEFSKKYGFTLKRLSILAQPETVRNAFNNALVNLIIARRPDLLPLTQPACCGICHIF